ncbi:MAG: dockerin type I domain-containing protein [Candidatus Methanoplasma sp.]|jgi:iron complex transport system substrate-binding protein|nr:dockerin type I domain-containing protein [Candidatus Methanoplasma sp.]
MNPKIAVVILVGVLVAAGISMPLILNANNEAKRALDMELEIYGNANGDWTIDSADVERLEKIISGEEVKTTFADANGDGRIDQKDIDQVNGIIKNTASRIWLKDGVGNDRNVGTNPQRVFAEYLSNVELMLILGQKDKIVGIDAAAEHFGDFYFGKDGTKDLTVVQSSHSPPWEVMEELDLDIILAYNWTSLETKWEKLPTVDVFYLGMYAPGILDREGSSYVQAYLKAGYIFRQVDRAEDYVEWYLGTMKEINDKSADVPDADRPSVLMTGVAPFTMGPTRPWTVATIIDPMDQSAVMAGAMTLGKTVLSAEMYAGGPTQSTWSVGVDPETIAVTDIDYAFCLSAKYSFGGSISATAPDSGYGVKDRTDFDDFQKMASENQFMDNTHVYLITNNLREGGSGGLLLTAYIAKIIYPDLFKDIDPLDYHQKYVEWMGIDADVREEAVFISPSF